MYTLIKEFAKNFLKHRSTNLLSVGGLSWWIFALAGLIAILISLTTVSWQSLLTAKRNPVESLRYE